WPDAGNPQFSDARIEINASNLNVEDLYFGNRAFWRRPWPITFGTTNTLEQAMGVPASPKSKQMELQVRDVSREYAVAYINAILPLASDFCSKLGAPFPER